MFEAGSIVVYNSLWRLGQHHDYKFFRVERVTAAGSCMGRYLTSKRTIESYDHDSCAARWHVDASQAASTSRRRRLPHPTWGWRVVSDDELTTGIAAVSCVA